MNRLWRILVCAMLLMTFVYGGGQAFAEQKANDWPPLSGVYMRKTAGGVPNGRIDVFVKPFNGDCAVLAAVESRNYNGNDYAESDMAPRIYAAGRMDVGLNSAEVILTHGYTDKRNPVPDPKELPLMTCITYDAAVTNKEITLTPKMFDKTRAMRTDPDLEGTYVFAGPYNAPSQFIAIAWVRMQNPQLTGLHPGMDYRYEDNFVADGMEKNYPGIGAIKPSYELKAYDGGKLLRTFLVSHDLDQIYVIRPDGGALLIYNGGGAVG